MMNDWTPNHKLGLIALLFAGTALLQLVGNLS